MSRISLQQVHGAVDRLNMISKRKYRLDGAYGGHKLVVLDGPGVRDVTFGYGPTSELYYIIHSIIRYLEIEHSKETH